MLSRLRELGSANPRLRDGHIPKAGPLKTDQDFFIIDAPFPPLLTVSDLKPSTDATEAPASSSSSSSTLPQPASQGKSNHNRSSSSSTGWEVTSLATAIKSIEGVLEVGIFSGRTGPEAIESGTIGGQRPVACYFGMADGTVTVRKASPRLDG